jgi:hypothetical protein
MEWSAKMPDKPLWFDRLPRAIRELEEDPEPWVHRPTLEALLGVGRRRAQQLLSPLAHHRIGTSLVASRVDVIAHLKRVVAGDQAWYEERRRRKLWVHIEQARRAWVEQPPVLVEVSETQIREVERHDFDGLPEGVELAPGSITVRFHEPDEALQKLMALAMAISQNRLAFDERVALRLEAKAAAGGPALPG